MPERPALPPAVKEGWREGEELCVAVQVSQRAIQAAEDELERAKQQLAQARIDHKEDD